MTATGDNDVDRQPVARQGRTPGAAPADNLVCGAVNRSCGPTTNASHISCGAETPNRPSARASTACAASLSAKRNGCSSEPTIWQSR